LKHSGIEQYIEVKAHIDERSKKTVIADFEL